MSCPVCGKEADPKYRPFCSKRCADVDLGRWLRGGYAVPMVEEEPDEDPAGGVGGIAEGAGDKPH